MKYTKEFSEAIDYAKEDLNEVKKLKDSKEFMKTFPFKVDKVAKQFMLKQRIEEDDRIGFQHKQLFIRAINNGSFTKKW